MFLKPATSPHVHSGNTVRRVMLTVLLALLPGLAAYTWFFGWGLLVNIVFAIVLALLSEAIVLKLRRRPLWPFLSDGSALVTATLLAMTLPPLSPWWITALGVCFAIVVAKHLYGGLGYNPFNPAMLGYVMLLVSFPREMTSWLPVASFSPHPLGLFETLSFIFGGHLPAGLSFDVLTEATPLDSLKNHLGQGNTVMEIRAQLGLDDQTSHMLSIIPIFGWFGGKGWEWVNAGFLLGGLYLIWRRVISWHIPVAMLGSLAVIAFVFYIIDPAHHASPLFHLFTGAAMLGAFFIATDPVTAATSRPGRLVYGAGIGLLVYIIRQWGGYPDAIAFAVLLMNMTVPIIDSHFKPRVFGHSRR